MKNSFFNKFINKQSACFAMLMLFVYILYSPFFSNPPVFDDWTIFAGGQLANYSVTPFNFRPRTFPYFTIGFIQALFQSFEIQRQFNALLHAVNGILLLKLVLDLTKGESNSPCSSSAFIPALMLAIIFVAHPMAVYGVGYLAQRTILFATFFSLLALIAFQHALLSGNRTHILYSAFACSAAMLSKEHAITIPFAVACLNFFVSANRPFRQFSIPLLGLCAPAVILVFLDRLNLIGTVYEIYTIDFGFGLEETSKWPICDGTPL